MTIIVDYISHEPHINEACTFTSELQSKKPQDGSDSKVNVAHVILYFNVISGLIVGFIKLSLMTVWINLVELFNICLNVQACRWWLLETSL